MKFDKPIFPPTSSSLFFSPFFPFSQLQNRFGVIIQFKKISSDKEKNRKTKYRRVIKGQF